MLSQEAYRHKSEIKDMTDLIPASNLGQARYKQVHNQLVKNISVLGSNSNFSLV